ncbi:hypothetical protein A0256_21625 [Mucilaginibacter sp. PAMC 26640]|nr:hypothetical protein A0256_21625 [Mucilaginibacter sp. PAMC 26640]
MDDQFDKKLSSRISEVFDNYEYPTAEEGWTELRKKFPVKEERKVAWLWWSSAAAILLVFLGLGIWMTNEPDMASNVAGNFKNPQADTTTGIENTAGNNTRIAQSQLAADSTVNSAVEQHANRGSYPNQQLANNNYAAKGSKAVDVVSTPAIIHPNGVNTGLTKNSDQFVIGMAKPDAGVKTDNNNVGVINDGKNGKSSVIASVNQADTAQKTENKTDRQQVANVSTPVIVDHSTATTIAANPPTQPIEEMFKREQPQRKKEPGDKKDSKKVNFSVYAATYFNYAEGSANRVNAGAGFTSDIRLSKNIKLSTGVSLAQNTLSYANTPPLATGRALAEAAPAIKSAGFFNTTASVAEFQNYNASLVGLDIPLNIKFEFNPEKTDAYFSAGLSSGTFIDERYTYSYAYKTNGLIDKTVPTQDQTTTSSFNNFYFAKTLNLSFGMGYPIGKNRLIIEPFLKYPLSGLGTQDIHFGAGGVNLKFSFKTTKIIKR